MLLLVIGYMNETMTHVHDRLFREAKKKMFQVT